MIMSPGGKLSLCLAFAVLLVFATVPGFDSAVAEETPASPPEQQAVDAERTIMLGLNDAVLRALEANLDIVVERYNPDIADAAVMTAKGEFDPVTRVDYSYSDAESPQTIREGLASDAGSTETTTKSLTLTLDGKIPSGTEYETVFMRDQSQFTQINAFDPDTMTFVDVRNPGQYDLDLSFRLTQPLLKDFGFDANLAEIRIARGERNMSLEEFRRRVIDVIAEVQSGYWDLVAAIANVRVTERSLALAQNLLDENRIRLKVGTMAPLEVLQAETGVAQREEEVVVARSLVRDAEDNLKRLLNMSRDTEDWNFRITPTEQPVFTKKEIDLLAQLELAFEKRPDYRRSLMQIENDAINERFTRNQLLPTLDLNGEYEFRAVNGDFEDGFEDIRKGTSPSWILGATADYPIGNHTAKGNYRKAQLETKQSEKEAENLRLSIIVEVNKAVRDIRTNMKRIEVTQKAVELAEESLKAEQKKLEVGVSTSHDVLEFEEEFFDAQRREILAKLEYKKALISLATATGTLLEENDIVIEENL